MLGSDLANGAIGEGRRERCAASGRAAEHAPLYGPYDPELLVGIGNAGSLVCDIDELNAAPAASPLFAELAGAPDTRAQNATGTPDEELLLCALPNHAHPVRASDWLMMMPI